MGGAAAAGRPPEHHRRAGHVRRHRRPRTRRHPGPPARAVTRTSREHAALDVARLRDAGCPMTRALAWLAALGVCASAPALAFAKKKDAMKPTADEWKQAETKLRAHYAGKTIQ